MIGIKNIIPPPRMLEKLAASVEYVLKHSDKLSADILSKIDGISGNILNELQLLLNAKADKTELATKADLQHTHTLQDIINMEDFLQAKTLEIFDWTWRMSKTIKNDIINDELVETIFFSGSKFYLHVIRDKIGYLSNGNYETVAYKIFRDNLNIPKIAKANIPKNQTTGKFAYMYHPTYTGNYLATINTQDADGTGGDDNVGVRLYNIDVANLTENTNFSPIKQNLDFSDLPTNHTLHFYSFKNTLYAEVALSLPYFYLNSAGEVYYYYNGGSLKLL
jgi:hypothetical protein